MNVPEERVDLRIMDPERIAEGRRGAELLFVGFLRSSGVDRLS